MTNQRQNCRFYGSMIGCQSGNFCEYNHINPNSVPLCHYYNNCRYGNKCKFRHFDFNNYHNINNNAYIQYQMRLLHQTMNVNNNLDPFNQLSLSHNNSEAIETIQSQPVRCFDDAKPIISHSIPKGVTNAMRSNDKNENEDIGYKFISYKYLLNGYIRDIQQLLKQQLIIPNEIYNLCYSYYLCQFKESIIIIGKHLTLNNKPSKEPLVVFLVFFFY